MKQKFLPVDTKVSSRRYGTICHIYKPSWAFESGKYRLRRVPRLCLKRAQRPAKLIGAGSRTGTATNTFQLTDHLINRHSLYKSTDSLKISVASACKTYLFHNTVLHLCFDTFAARSLSRKIYIHKVVLMISICNKTAEAYKESKFPAHL